MISYRAFADEFVKIAQGRSVLKDFVGGIDPTGGATFQYGMTDYEKPQHASPSLARAAGTAGGLVGGALVIPSAIGGLIGGVKGFGGGGGMGARLARAGRGFVSGAKQPIKMPIDVIRSRKALAQMRTKGIGSLTDSQLSAMRGVASGLPGGALLEKANPTMMRAGLRSIRATAGDIPFEFADKQLKSGLASGIATLGTSGALGAGSAYLQYGKGQQAAEKYLG